MNQQIAPSPWSHLPNAAHIDHILADVKVNPNHWKIGTGHQGQGEVLDNPEYYQSYKEAFSAAYSVGRLCKWNPSSKKYHSFYWRWDDDSQSHNSQGPFQRNFGG